MAHEFGYTTPLLLYLVIFLVLLFSSLNHEHNFFTTLSFSFSFPLSNLTNTSTQNRSTLPTTIPEQYYFHNSSTTNITSTVVERKKSRFELVEEGLARARAAIKDAILARTYHSDKEESFVPRGSIYRNPYAFHQSYIEMKKRFRVWAYKEGEPPLFHIGPTRDIYSIEGQFIAELESGKSPFSACHPDEALVFFLPVSIQSIRKYATPNDTYSRKPLQNVVKDYIGVISTKHPYWNRSSGADHFLISCHDWAPDVTAIDPELYKHFIRVLCNANTSEGFKLVRDVSLPEIFLLKSNLGTARLGQPAENRSILAFFAGGAHGYARKTLFNYWKGKDNDVQVYAYLPKTLNYTVLLGQSKFCLCPSGWEVASPRVVESIYAGCVPVILSDHYVLPFSDVLDWSQFSVHIPLARIPEIKTILQEIPMHEYLEKQKKVIQVQQHFKLHRPAKPFDMMHMVMHSVWLRRLNIRLP